jgi:hypothetical protein
MNQVLVFKSYGVVLVAASVGIKPSLNYDFPIGNQYPFAVKTTDTGSPKIINQYADKDMIVFKSYGVVLVAASVGIKPSLYH